VLLKAPRPDKSIDGYRVEALKPLKNPVLEPITP
jgi:hypothetical protein